MKALVTGATGFVGPYLVDYLRATGNDVYGMDRRASQQDHSYSGDITDRDFVMHVFSEVRPDCVFHLAGYSLVKTSFLEPLLVNKINVEGTRNIAEAMKQFIPHSKLLYVSSAVVYGTPSKTPIAEVDDVRPGSPYAQSRVDTEKMLSSYELPWIVARSFNHTGPGQTQEYVLADWCRQAVAIELGLQNPVIHVGNIESVRDFMDVRDIVKIYVALLQSGKSHETYNVGSGIGYRLGDLLKMILSFISVPVEVVIDSEKVRSQDTTLLVSDTNKLMGALGNFNLHYSIQQTLQDIMQYWREKLVMARDKN